MVTEIFLVSGILQNLSAGARQRLAQGAARKHTCQMLAVVRAHMGIIRRLDGFGSGREGFGEILVRPRADRRCFKLGKSGGNGRQPADHRWQLHVQRQLHAQLGLAHAWHPAELGDLWRGWGGGACVGGAVRSADLT